MKRMRRGAIDAAIEAMVIKPLTRRLLVSLRRSAMKQARAAITGRARAVLPTTLVESPVLVAITARMFPPRAPRSRDRQGLLRALLVATVVVAVATGVTFAIAALRSRRRPLVSDPAPPPARPIVIPVDVTLEAGPADQEQAAPLDASESIETIGPELSEHPMS